MAACVSPTGAPKPQAVTARAVGRVELSEARGAAAVVAPRLAAAYGL
jgi:hypothetical protein